MTSDKKKSKSLWFFHLHKKRKAPKEKLNAFRYQLSSDSQVTKYYKPLQNQTLPLVCKDDFQEVALNLNGNQPLANKPDCQLPLNSTTVEHNGWLTMAKSDLQIQAEDAIRCFNKIMSVVFFSPGNTVFISKYQHCSPEVSPEYVIHLIDEVLSEGFDK